MQTVNIHEAKTHFSRLLKSVEDGEQIVIANAGRPVAVLSPWRPPKNRIAPPGHMKDKGWWMAEDFNDSTEDLFDDLTGNRPLAPSS